MNYLLILFLILCVSCNPSKKKSSGILSGPGSSSGDTTGGSTSGGDSGEDDEETPPAFGIIFVSTTALDGRGAGNGGTGLQAFDDACAENATAKGLTGTFKAIMSGATRRACSTANCSGGPTERLDWPLATRMEYRREDGTTIIGKTNKNGIFSLPLTNAVGTSSATIWTGLNTNWTTALNCFDWSLYDFGFRSNANDVNLATASVSCDNSHQFLCAEVKADVPAATQPAYRKIFVTSNTYSPGVMGVDGVARFDGICESEKVAKGFTEDDIFKALVTSNGNGGTHTKRIACLTAYCGNGTSEQVNWVLDSNREYRREDGTTVIATTNANAIFEYPLTNSITGSADEYWTGFYDTWAILNIGVNDDCASWTTNDGGAVGQHGLGNQTDSTAFSKGTVACNINRKILCVEQTR